MTPSFRFPLPAGGTELALAWFPSRSGGTVRALGLVPLAKRGGNLKEGGEQNSARTIGKTE